MANRTVTFVVVDFIAPDARNPDSVLEVVGVVGPFETQDEAVAFANSAPDREVFALSSPHRLSKLGELL
jgi:hypothetical protein